MIAALSFQFGCQSPEIKRAAIDAPSGASLSPQNGSNPSAHRPGETMIPPGSSDPIRAAVPPSEQALAGLTSIIPREGRSRPVVAVIGHNSGTEVTDYVVPYAILSASGVADVWALSTRPGPIRMFPSLTIEPKATVGEFDVRFPAGADIVIVPAVHDDDDPELLDWIATQANQGATIVGVCDGVWVLGRAGLLAGRRGVGHWYSMSRLRDRFPETTWLRDQRFVADGPVITTTGVTASMPISIALVEAIAGPEKADSLATALGVRSWSPHHDSERFSLDMGHVGTAAANWLAFWGWETVGIPIRDGVDEIALSLTADAYSRTYRSSAHAIAAADAPVTTRRGLRILPDVVSSALIPRGATRQHMPVASQGPGTYEHEPVANGDPVDYLVPLREDLPARALDDALAGITQRYGPRTSAFVALQLEYAP